MTRRAGLLALLAIANCFPTSGLAQVPLAAARAIGASSLPPPLDITNAEIQQILIKTTTGPYSARAVGDVTEQVVGPETARACRMSERDQSVFEGMQEKTIVPASAYDAMVKDYQQRCDLRIINGRRGSARVVYAIYNGPASPNQPRKVQLAVGSANLIIAVLGRHLDEEAFRAAALKSAR